MLKPNEKMMRKLLFAALLPLFLTCTAQAQVRKSLSVLGDSYSTFTDFVEPDTNFVWYCEGNAGMTDVRHVEETWWHQLAMQNGLKICQNNSFSGATICHTGYNKDDYSDRSFCTRLKFLGNPDIIAVFGGTNDSWAGSPIGNYQYGEWTKQDLYNFRPAMAYLLNGLKLHYPNVPVYVIINDILSDEVTSSMKEICDHYAVSYILLHDIDKQNGHPTVKGMSQIAEQLKDIIK